VLSTYRPEKSRALLNLTAPYGTVCGEAYDDAKRSIDSNE
jgi:hypothetical protein